jgi:hypothetical protein
MNKWIGVDLDGTLAEYQGAMGKRIGAPIAAMLGMVRALIDSGIEVRIFTARASDPNQLPAIKGWLKRHGLGQCPVTNIKDFDCHLIIDDRAVRAEWNKGRCCSGCQAEAIRRMKQLGLQNWPTQYVASRLELI